MAENGGNSEQGVVVQKGRVIGREWGDTVNRERWGKREGDWQRIGGYSEQREVGQKGRKIGRE